MSEYETKSDEEVNTPRPNSSNYKEYLRPGDVIILDTGKQYNKSVFEKFTCIEFLTN